IGDLHRRGRADTMNVGERDNHALVGGDVHPGNTSHLVLHAPQGRRPRWPTPISSRCSPNLRDVANSKTFGWQALWPACRTAPQVSNERRAYGESSAASTAKGTLARKRPDRPQERVASSSCASTPKRA